MKNIKFLNLIQGAWTNQEEVTEIIQLGLLNKDYTTFIRNSEIIISFENAYKLTNGNHILSNYIATMQDYRNTCPICGNHTNSIHKGYRDNGGCVGSSPQCSLCSSLSNSDYYNLKSDKYSVPTILESLGLIGDHKDFVTAVIKTQELGMKKFLEISSNASVYIESLEFSLKSNDPIVASLNSALRLVIDNDFNHYGVSISTNDRGNTTISLEVEDGKIDLNIGIDKISKTIEHLKEYHNEYIEMMA